MDGFALRPSESKGNLRWRRDDYDVTSAGYKGDAARFREQESPYGKAHPAMELLEAIRPRRWAHELRAQASSYHPANRGLKRGFLSSIKAKPEGRADPFTHPSGELTL